MTEHAIDVTESTFAQEVVAESHRRPVLVDFWAPWCGPCRALTPVLEQVAAEFEGTFLLAKVNSDDNPALSGEFGVRSIPNVKAFVGGELVDEFVGAQPASAVRAFVQRLLPSAAELKRREAAVLADSGDLAGAVALLEAALAEEPRNDRIRVDLAEGLLRTDRGNDARQVIDAVSPLAAQDNALARRLAGIRVTLTAPDAGDEAALRAKLEADPADHDSRIRLANLLVATGRHEAGMEELLESLKRDRRYGEDAARKAMLGVFDLLGSSHPLVPAFRRKLAATLN